MKSLLPLRLERDKSSMVLDTGQPVRYFQEKQVQQTCLDLKSSGRSRRPVVEIQRSNDRKRMVLDPGENLTPGVSKFLVEHQGLGREAWHVVIDKVRCFCDYMSGIKRFWSEQQILDHYRCSITKMVNYNLCVVAVEPRLACLNRFPSCSAESTSFFIHGSAGPTVAQVSFGVVEGLYSVCIFRKGWSYPSTKIC